MEKLGGGFLSCGMICLQLVLPIYKKMSLKAIKSLYMGLLGFNSLIDYLHSIFIFILYIN